MTHVILVSYKGTPESVLPVLSLTESQGLFAPVRSSLARAQEKLWAHVKNPQEQGAKADTGRIGSWPHQNVSKAERRERVQRAGTCKAFGSSLGFY